jgi:hypothetical protein
MHTRYQTYGLFPWVRGFAVVACVIMGSAQQSVVGGSPADSMVLFTQQEARELRLNEREWRHMTKARALSMGPTIIVRRPPLTPGDIPTIETQSPTALDVIFEPRYAPVRMDSLNVTARKGLFSKSLTELLRPYIRGDTIEVSRVEIPTGRFMLDVSIADTEGNATNTSYHLEVGANEPGQ